MRSDNVKSTVEKLSPTRVRINVEVPFTELEPEFDRAFKQLAKQVRLPGFRPGKAPRKLLEARVGREAMLDQVVSEALPGRYSEAVTSSEVSPLGQPDIEITKKEYGEDLTFTAEVDIRPDRASRSGRAEDHRRPDRDQRRRGRRRVAVAARALRHPQGRRPRRAER